MRMVLLSLAAGALAAAAGARAQVDTRSSAPIDITANQAEVINSKCEAIWRGAAEALQGQTRLRADTISVYSRVKSGAPGQSGQGGSSQPACDGVERIVAEGDVYYVTPQQNVRGDRAVYDQKRDQIVVTGNVIVVQGNDVARGDRLTIDVGSKQATMASRARGAGQPDRVRGVFYPAKDNGQGPAGGAPPGQAPQ